MDNPIIVGNLVTRSGWSPDRKVTVQWVGTAYFGGDDGEIHATLASWKTWHPAPVVRKFEVTTEARPTKDGDRYVYQSGDEPVIFTVGMGISCNPGTTRNVITDIKAVPA